MGSRTAVILLDALQGAELIDIIRDEKLLENCRAQSEVMFSYKEKLLAIRASWTFADG